MPLRILHTADIHLGMKFVRGYPVGVQESLVQARFETLRRLVATANKEDCELFVVAGDLFHSQNVPKRDVLRAAEILKGFDGRLIMILPGNHDYVQKVGDPLWTSFNEGMSENTLLLDEPRAYDLRGYDLDMIVYPAPCTSKHSSTNAIDWMRYCAKAGDVRWHVGVAHGSLEGLSPDFNGDYYPMRHDELQAVAMDVWLMGHTHLRWPDAQSGAGERVFFPSTPEPDGFDCGHSGYAWLLDLDEDGTVRHLSIDTGSYRFVTMEVELSTEDDVEALRNAFRARGREKQLVKLRMRGRMPGSAYDERSSLLRELDERVLYLEADMSELVREITSKDIDREFTEGSFPHSLLTSLADEQQDPLCIQMAYEMIQGARR